MLIHVRVAPMPTSSLLPVLCRAHHYYQANLVDADRLTFEEHLDIEASNTIFRKKQSKQKVHSLEVVVFEQERKNSCNPPHTPRATTFFFSFSVSMPGVHCAVFSRSIADVCIMLPLGDDDVLHPCTHAPMRPCTHTGRRRGTQGAATTRMLPKQAMHS